MDDDLYHWFAGAPFPADKYPEKYQELIWYQGQIGWDRLLYGRFSSHWSNMPNLLLPRPTASSIESNLWNFLPYKVHPHDVGPCAPGMGSSK